MILIVRKDWIFWYLINQCNDVKQHTSKRNFIICQFKNQSKSKSIQWEIVLKRGDTSSGFLTGFVKWYQDDLKELAKQSVYKKRINEHLDQINLVIANREKELQNTYLLHELDKLKDRKQLIESFI